MLSQEVHVKPLSYNKELISSSCAGLFAGACGVFVGYPFDTMKVKLQSVSGSGAPAEVVSYNIAGMRALYRGLMIPMLTAGGMQSLNFGMYDTFKRNIRNRDSTVSNLNASFAAGGIAGMFLSTLSTPIQLLKVQMQTHRHLSLRELLVRDIYKSGRWRVLYRGFGVTAICDSVGRGFYMYSYEAAKHTLAVVCNISDSTNDRLLPMPIRMASAAYAGMISWLVLYPLDTLKTLVQSSYSGPGAISYLHRIVTTETGFGAVKVLYRGCMYAVIRAAPVAATILPLYEYVQHRMLEWCS